MVPNINNMNQKKQLPIEAAGIRAEIRAGLFFSGDI